MTFLDYLLAGGPDYRVTGDLGGAVVAPAENSKEGFAKFQVVAKSIIVNDGSGYSVIHRLTHRTSRYPEDYIDRIVINIPSR